MANRRPNRGAKVPFKECINAGISKPERKLIKKVREKRFTSRDTLIRDSPVDVPPQTRLTVALTNLVLTSIASSPDPSTPQGYLLSSS